MVLGGLWFGDKKPVMSTFLKPFKASLEVLETKGTCCNNGHHYSCLLGVTLGFNITPGLEGESQTMCYQLWRMY